MANKPKSKIKKNRVKIPNVGPGKNQSISESQTSISDKTELSTEKQSEIPAPKKHTPVVNTKNKFNYKHEISRISLVSLITFGLLAVLIFIQ